jgi:hypothetical protein
MRRVAVALLHYPVLDRSGQEVTTAITNLDVHDIARSAFTYGLERYYVVHPIQAQRTLVDRVRNHWVNGSGKLRIPDREAPMRGVNVVSSIEDALQSWGEGEPVEFWTTGAAETEGMTEHRTAAELLTTTGPKVLLGFGTGWGMSPRLHQLATRRLAPIRSPRSDGYNHLSVRAAAAILFDRLLGNAKIQVGSSTGSG